MRRYPIKLLLATCLSAAIALPGCSGGERHSQQTRTETNTTVQTAGDFGDSLDLSRLPDLVKQAKDADDLEQILNTSGVNNLDTNKDGKTDYLNVEESREGGNQSLILFTNEDGQRMDIAKIDITKTQSTADVAVSGNPAYYGSTPVVYRSSYGLGDVLLAAWLFNVARPVYAHPGYYFGNYPGYYRNYYRAGYVSAVPRAAYRSRVSTGSFTTTSGRKLVSSASRRATGSTSSFSTGSSSRRLNGGSSFSTTTNKRPASGSIFGRSNSSGSSFSRSSTGNSSFGSSSNRSRPSFSFGSSSSRSSSGRSSFGSSSSRSSGSSFGSSSRRRR